MTQASNWVILLLSSSRHSETLANSLFVSLRTMKVKLTVSFWDQIYHRATPHGVIKILTSCYKAFFFYVLEGCPFKLAQSLITNRFHLRNLRKDKGNNLLMLITKE